MASKPTTSKNYKSTNFLMEESLRISVQKQIESFIADEDILTLNFPVTFTNTQRGFVHKYVQAKGLKSKSHGKGANRCLTIYKPNSNTRISYDPKLELTKQSIYEMQLFLKENSVSARDKSEAKGLSESKIPKKYYYGFASFKLSVPPTTSKSQDILEGHAKLPITNYRQFIVDMINSNRALVISGDTGSGKTTQVPQYILEDHCSKQEKCRIICTQPRRIAAVSMADRVCFERNEEIGTTVGYQIRLESKINPSTNLIYTTSGYLLRCLISDSSADWLKRITHIVMDEVHERDKYTDFLLIAVKEAMIKNQTLKVILMSATIDTNIFTEYLYNCQLVNIPGRMHPVAIYQLEDVLGIINSKGQPQKEQKQRPVHKEQSPNVNKTTMFLDDDRRELINTTLQECFYSGSDFNQFFYLVTGENVDVNVKHTETDLNALMIAAINGLPDIIYSLLHMGADPSIVGGFGLTAKEWAIKYQHKECKELLENAEARDADAIANEEKIRKNKILLQLYLDKTNETDIDHRLLFSTIIFIHEQMPEGSILVFLPGYDAILEQLNTINEGNITRNTDVLVLHGNMQTTDQKKAFARSAAGCRKIILSTNIAETSLTIEDVVYVIDCGKVKQISYDSLSESTSLTATWISKACAKQRMGRAGRTRPGFCYRLYSKQRFDAMEEFTLPELLRIPLTELCLHARIMTKNTIFSYLSKAIQPPPTSTINQSIKILKTIGALNEKEDVTELGYRLVDLPVDVQLGKMLLYAILMRCLDPVLTIVSALSVKDPFVLNFDGENKAHFTRKTLAEDSCSDLIVFIKLFHLWTQHKTSGDEQKFCRDHSVGNGIMELINGFRSQILGQLRTIGLISPRGNGDISDLNRNSNKFSVIKACFTAAFYPNVCRVDRTVGNLKSKHAKKLLPHITSILRDKNIKTSKTNLINLPSEWVVFEEKSRVERLCLVKNNTVVSPITIALFGGPMYIPEGKIILADESDSENEESLVKFILDDWIYFMLDDEIATMLHQLRIKLNALFIKTLCNLDIKFDSNSSESKVIDLVSSVLEREDACAGFKSPKDVGMRPLPSSVARNWRNSNKSQRYDYGIPLRHGKPMQSKYSNVRPSNISMNNTHANQPNRKAIAYSNICDECRSIPNRNNCNVCGSIDRNKDSRDFELYVANYKCQITLKPRVRFFILHGSSKAAILESYKPNQPWQYSPNSLKKFINIINFTLDVDIILFFLIPQCCFFGMGRVYRAESYINIESLSTSEVSIDEVKNIRLRRSGGRKMVEFLNGEEILNTYLSEELFKLFLRKSYSS